MSWQLLTSNDELAQLMSEQQAAQAVIVDTEFMRRDTFHPQAALIQLCFPGTAKAWLLDPLTITDFGPLCDLFENRSVLKVIHSPSEDLEVFQHFLGVLPEPLFDTQRAAAFLNRGFGLGYRNLVEMMSGEQIPKGETRSNWLARPLTASQLDYAAQDVMPLVPIYAEFFQQLQLTGKLDWLLEEGAHAVANARLTDTQTHARIKSGWKLERRNLAVLIAICEWREQRARRVDKPRGWIISDSLCYEIAEQCPRGHEDLRRLGDMPPALLRKHSEEILAVIDSALNQPADALPARLPAPLNANQRGILKEVKRVARELAQDWKLEPEALLPAKDYELLVRIGLGEKLDKPERWLGWRESRLVQPLLEMVGGAVN